MANAVFMNVYKLKKGTSIEEFTTAIQRLVDEEISKSKGFISSTLMVDRKTWVDTVVFETEDDLKAFEENAKKPSELAKAFYSHINFFSVGNKMLRLSVVNDFKKDV